jgi:hypothetical protein
MIRLRGHPRSPARFRRITGKDGGR